MDQRIIAMTVLALVVGSIAGTAGAVTIESFPQQVTQGDHEVTSGKKISIDTRATVYSGSAVDGYDVTVRNDGSAKLTINVTVRLLLLDGTDIATASAENIVLTGSTYTFGIRFDVAVDPSTFDKVVVEAAAS